MGKKNVFIFIVTMLVGSSIYAQVDLPEIIEVQDLPDSAKYLKLKYDPTTGIRHLIYEEGSVVQTEPDGDQQGIVTNFDQIPEIIPLQDLYYGYSNQPEVSGSFQTELVFEDVFPYQYNFQIDSLGRVHSAFISNYTLIYGLRTAGESGEWSFQSIFTNDFWYSMMPDIALGEDELPRIVFAGVYRSAGIEYAGGDQFTDGSKRSIQYAFSTQNGNSLDWTVKDITESVSTFNLTPVHFHALNPGLSIHDGISYVAFNGDYPAAVVSKMEMISFPEIPESNFNFTQARHDWIFTAATRSTKFRTPSILLLKHGILIVAGTSNTGGAMAFLLKDINEMPESDLASRKIQWSYRQIEPEHSNIPIPSISGVYDEEGDQFVAAYSYNLTSVGTYVNDIFLVSIANSGTENLYFNYTRITDTVNVDHGYSSPILINDRIMEIFSLENTNNGNKLVYCSIKLGIPTFNIESDRRIIPFLKISFVVPCIIIISRLKKKTSK